jgi:catechol 2,3-dioxygenase-like lactoylglutathione lyase family enzyme
MALHRLADVTVGVPDLAASSAFYRAFGLTDGSPGWMATRDGGDQLKVVGSPHRNVQHISVEADDGDDLGRIEQRLIDAGHSTTRSDDDGVPALHTREPHSRLGVTVRVAPRRTVTAPATEAVNLPGAPRRTNRPAQAVMGGEPVRPSSLSHLVIGSPDQPATLAFFTELIGFEISDQLPGIIAFTRCSEMHHNLAIQLAPCPMMHHMAFEVDTIDDVARGGSELIRADEGRQLWGLGRHAIGSNWFWYLREPSGHYVEYTADIDRITSQDLYQPKEWAGHEFLYSMGQPPPPVFLQPEDMDELIAASQA